jgi:hypothetical protein
MCESSAPAAPSDKQTSITELPEWARGYAKNTLAKGAALTDINQNPYQQYGANRIAGFSPMQQRSMQDAANMRPSQQLGTATDLASAAGVGALGTNYQGGQFSGGVFGKGAADYYMNPYQQNVTDIGKREAARQSAIQGTQQQAQAAQAGAFGGSRDAIMRAERERNLGQQMGDIQAQGSNAAFQQAQQQFNADQGRYMQAQQLGEQSRQYGAGLNMQGLQTGLQAAGQLGQLGQTQYGQQMGINQLQNQYGSQMQQQAQRPLDMAYQDFQNQQNYPYKQLGYMSDLINKLPVGQQSTKSMYEAPPSALQTVGAAGMGLYGAKQLGMFAEGGVTSQDNIEGILDKLSDQQLKQAKQTALARRDVEQANMIDAEMAQRASIRGGLGGAFNQIPEEQQEEMMAGGGIIAFQDRGLVAEPKQPPATLEDVQALLDENNEEAGYGGNAEDKAYFRSEGRRIYGELANEKSSEAMTDAQRREETKKNYAEVESMAGPSPYKTQGDRIAGLETQQAGELQQQKGLSALAAIPEMLKGNNAVRGIGGAGGKFADVYGKALQADRVEKRALISARNNLEDAQYKMKVGMVGDARQLTAESRRDRQAAEAARIAKLRALGTLAATQERANRPAKGTTPNFDIQNRELIAADLAATTPMKKGETPEQYEKRLNAMAAREIYGAKGTKDITSKVTSNVKSERDITPEGAEAGAKSDTVAAALAKDQEAAVVNIKKSIPYLQAMKAKDSAAMQKMENDARAGVVSGFEKARKQVNPSAKSVTPTVQPLPDNPKDPNSYKDGVVYKTSKGNAKWNATTQKFTPVP